MTTKTAHPAATGHLVTCQHPKTGAVSVYGPSHLAILGWVRAARQSNGEVIDVYVTACQDSHLRDLADGRQDFYRYATIDMNVTTRGKAAWDAGRATPQHQHGGQCRECGAGLSWFDRTAGAVPGLCFDCA